MTIVINMAPANYDTLLNKLSVAYALLKNGIVIHRSEGTQDRLIQIPCELAEAEMLLYCAREFALKLLLKLKRHSDRHNLSESRIAGNLVANTDGGR